jgi:HK97 family phage major capsid protein
MKKTRIRTPSVSLPIQYREFEIRADDVDMNNRTARFSFSSSNFVPRWFGYEQLSHDKGAMITKRLDAGAVPFLADHDSKDQIGRVTDYEVKTGKNGRASATVMMSRSARATELLQDMQDRIRTSISVGYVPHTMRRMRDDEIPDDLFDDDDAPDDEEDVDVFCVTRWEPMEVSLVSLPADVSVGVGRSVDGTEEEYLVRIEEETEPVGDPKVFKQNTANMNEPNPPNQNAGTITQGNSAPAPQAAGATQNLTVVDNGESIRAGERQRAAEITANGRRFHYEDDATRFVSEGRSSAEFNAFILERQAAQGLQTIVAADAPGFSRRDLRGYSLCKALMQGQASLDGLEREVSQEISRRLDRTPRGFFMPEEILARPMRRDLSVTVPPGLTPSPSTGGLTVQLTVEPSLIEVLRNRAVVARAGATMMGGLVGNLSMPRQTGVATATWNAENAPLTASSQTFDQVGLSPKRLGATTNYSKMLLAQSSLDIEEIVREDLLRIIALAQDLAAIYGTGPGDSTGPQPTGIMTVAANAPGAFAPGLRSPNIVFGGPASWQSVVEFEGNVESSNVSLDRAVAYITTPKTKAVWKTTPKAVNYPVYLWEGGGAQNAPGMVNGYAAFATNQINTGPAAVPNMVLFGVWSECILATWSGLDIVTDPYTLAPNFQIRIVMNLLTDIAFRHAIAFCASTDAGNQS